MGIRTVRQFGPFLWIPLVCSVIGGFAGRGDRGGPDLPVRFVNVAAEAGVTAPNVWCGVHEKNVIIEAKGSGLGFLDFDNDGRLDIYLTNGVRFGEEYTDSNRPTSHLYWNRGDGSFEDVTGRSGLRRSGWQTGVCAADFDNDGRVDLFTADWGRNGLYRNRGDGTFEEVSEQAGVRGTRDRWASGCTWLDFDLDGNLDLFVANYVELNLSTLLKPGDTPDCVWKGIPVLCGPRGLTEGSHLLYRNLGNGRFEDVTESSGIRSAGPSYAITAASADFDNDGWPDIYVAVDSRASMLFRNQGDGTFEETGMLAGCAFSENGTEQAGMGVGIGDFNRDGFLDIFKTNFQHDTCNLYQNNGDGTFRDIAIRAGLGLNTQYVNWGAGFVDFDNDGWPDIFHVTGHVYPNARELGLDIPMKTPRLAYRNLGDGRFEDVSSRLGPGVTEEFASRGCAFGDYDNDGDVDILVLNMNDPPSLLRCDSQTGNHWLTVQLVGRRTNRSAIGARVRVKVGEAVQTQEVLSGGSVMSQNDLRLHFGLGAATAADEVEVYWPVTRKTDRFEAVAADRIITIEEGSGISGRGE